MWYESTFLYTNQDFRKAWAYFCRCCLLFVFVSKKGLERKGKNAAVMGLPGDKTEALNVTQSLFSCLCDGKINKLQHTGMLIIPARTMYSGKFQNHKSVCHCTIKPPYNAMNIRMHVSDVQKGLDSQSWTRPWNPLHEDRAKVVWTQKVPLLTLHWSASFFFFFPAAFFWLLLGSCSYIHALSAYFHLIKY